MKLEVMASSQLKSAGQEFILELTQLACIVGVGKKWQIIR